MELLLQRDGASCIRLEPLTTDDCIELVSKTANFPVSLSAANHITQRAGGNPMFLVELVRGMVAAGQLSPISTIAPQDAPLLPVTVHDAILTVVDRLSAPAQAVLKVASVIGPEFDSVSLRLLQPCEGDAIADALYEIVESGEILQLEENTYAFRHDIIREAVYSLLLESQRVHFHTVLATFMARHGTGDLTAIADHCLAAHKYGEAAGHWLTTAREREAAGLKEGALFCVDKGLAALRAGEQHRSPQYDSVEFSLRVVRLSCHVSLRPLAKDTSAVFHAALEAAGRISSPSAQDLQNKALMMQLSLLVVDADARVRDEWRTEVIKAADDGGTDTDRICAVVVLVQRFWEQGHWDKLDEYREQLVSLHNHAVQHKFVTRYHLDVSLCAIACAVAAPLARGDVDAALSLADVVMSPQHVAVGQLTSRDAVTICLSHILLSAGLEAAVVHFASTLIPLVNTLPVRDRNDFLRPLQCYRLPLLHLVRTHLVAHNASPASVAECDAAIGAHPCDLDRVLLDAADQPEVHPVLCVMRGVAEVVLLLRLSRHLDAIALVDKLIAHRPSHRGAIALLSALRIAASKGAGRDLDEDRTGAAVRRAAAEDMPLIAVWLCVETEMALGLSAIIGGVQCSEDHLDRAPMVTRALAMCPLALTGGSAGSLIDSESSESSRKAKGSSLP